MVLEAALTAGAVKALGLLVDAAMGGGPAGGIASEVATRLIGGALAPPDRTAAELERLRREFAEYTESRWLEPFQGGVRDLYEATRPDLSRDQVARRLDRADDRFSDALQLVRGDEHLSAVLDAYGALVSFARGDLVVGRNTLARAVLSLEHAIVVQHAVTARAAAALADGHRALRGKTGPEELLFGRRDSARVAQQHASLFGPGGVYLRLKAMVEDHRAMWSLIAPRYVPGDPFRARIPEFTRTAYSEPGAALVLEIPRHVLGHFAGVRVQVQLAPTGEDRHADVTVHNDGPGQVDVRVAVVTELAAPPAPIPGEPRSLLAGQHAAGAALSVPRLGATDTLLIELVVRTPDGPSRLVVPYRPESDPFGLSFRDRRLMSG
jgi:hypothetical protein